MCSRQVELPTYPAVHMSTPPAHPSLPARPFIRVIPRNITQYHVRCPLKRPAKHPPTHTMQIKFEDEWWEATPEWQASGLFLRYAPSEEFKLGFKQRMSLENLRELISKGVARGAVGELETLLAALVAHAEPRSLPSMRSGKVSPPLPLRHCLTNAHHHAFDPPAQVAAAVTDGDERYYDTDTDNGADGDVDSEAADGAAARKMIKEDKKEPGQPGGGVATRSSPAPPPPPPAGGVNGTDADSGGGRGGGRRSSPRRRS